MHTVQLLLKTTEYDRRIMEKRFHAVSHIHNVLVSHAKKCLAGLMHDKEYLSAKAEYCALLKKDELSRDEKSFKKQLSGILNACIRSTDCQNTTSRHILKSVPDSSANVCQASRSRKRLPVYTKALRLYFLLKVKISALKNTGISTLSVGKQILMVLNFTRTCCLWNGSDWR